MEPTDPILEKINAAKTHFYSVNQKNMLFKNAQKTVCASHIMSSLDETEVFQRIFATNGNQFIFNYSVFKTVAHPNIYERMGEFMFQTAKHLISEYGKYDLIIDCKGITVSGIERYKDFVSTVSQLGLRRGENLLHHMEKIYVYNPPSFVNYGLQVLVPLVDTAIGQKIVLIPKST
jgi:hypothetical protein